jgi:hypothetical protein
MNIIQPFPLEGHMKPMQGIIAAVSIGVLAGIICFGCGVTSKKLNDAEKRIAALEQNGMPDSLLTDVRVLLVQIKTSKQYGGGPSPQKLYDSTMAVLSKAEMTYIGATSKVKPIVDSLRKTFDPRKQGLTGQQLIEADRLIKDVDSVIKMNKWPEAKIKCEMTDAALNSLLNDEKTAKEVKAKLIGTWNCTQKVKDKATKADFVEIKVFSFLPDGKIDIVEQRNGQTNETFKEDWKYQSGGTYSLKGDTILIAVNKEKCLKQSYMNLVAKNGKPQWVKKEKPGYDSTITSGKKDRYVAFADLKQNFKKR